MEFNKIDIGKIEEVPIVKPKTPEELFEECFVDLDKPIKPLDVLVYVGQDDRGFKSPAITRHEISCIYAPSKAKKSFLKSLIESTFIGGNANNYTDIIVGNRRTEGFLLSIDTEQGEFYAVNSFRRVERMVGSRYEKYIPLQLRRQSVKDRLKLIDWLIYKSKFAGKIDLITIDGLADLVDNTNDIEVSTELAERLLRWSADGMHICFILHKNQNSQKARGHLGTVATIKCETLISIDRITNDAGEIIEKNTVKVSCSHSRGVGFQDFYMSVNNDGLPFTHYIQTDNIFVNLNEIKEKKPLPNMTNKEAFNDNDVPF